MPSPVTTSAGQLVELELETAAFTADWNHCDQISNYLAQLVSHDRPDSFLYANLLSTVLNELLEAIFLQHAPSGAVRCSLSRQGQVDRLEFHIPVSPTVRSYYEESVAAAQHAGVMETYTRTLLAKEEPEQSLGFLELAADYRARLEIKETSSPGEVCLVVEVCLEDGGASA